MMKEKIEKSTYKLDAAIEKLKRREDSKMEGDVYLLSNIEKIKYMLSHVEPKNHHPTVFNLLSEADLDYDKKRISKILTKNLILSSKTIRSLCILYFLILLTISYFVFDFLDDYSMLLAIFVNFFITIHGINAMMDAKFVRLFKVNKNKFGE